MPDEVRRRRQMDCLPGRRRAPSALETAETLYKTAALLCHRVRGGKPNCRCVAGEGHGPYHFLLWREGSVQRRRYVRQADAEAVRRVIERRQRADRDRRSAAALATARLRELRAWLRELRAWLRELERDLGAAR